MLSWWGRRGITGSGVGGQKEINGCSLNIGCLCRPESSSISSSSQLLDSPDPLPLWSINPESLPGVAVLSSFFLSLLKGGTKVKSVVPNVCPSLYGALRAPQSSKLRPRVSASGEKQKRFFAFWALFVVSLPAETFRFLFAGPPFFLPCHSFGKGFPGMRHCALSRHRQRRT